MVALWAKISIIVIWIFLYPNTGKFESELRGSELLMCRIPDVTILIMLHMQHEENMPKDWYRNRKYLIY